MQNRSYSFPENSTLFNQLTMCMVRITTMSSDEVQSNNDQVVWCTTHSLSEEYKSLALVADALPEHG